MQPVRLRRRSLNIVLLILFCFFQNNFFRVFKIVLTLSEKPYRRNSPRDIMPATMDYHYDVMNCRTPKEHFTDGVSGDVILCYKIYCYI